MKQGFILQSDPQSNLMGPVGLFAVHAGCDLQTRDVCMLQLLAPPPPPPPQQPPLLLSVTAVFKV